MIIEIEHYSSSFTPLTIWWQELARTLWMPVSGYLDLWIKKQSKTMNEGRLLLFIGEHIYDIRRGSWRTGALRTRENYRICCNCTIGAVVELTHGSCWDSLAVEILGCWNPFINMIESITCVVCTLLKDLVLFNIMDLIVSKEIRLPYWPHSIFHKRPHCEWVVHRRGFAPGHHWSCTSGRHWGCTSGALKRLYFLRHRRDCTFGMF